MSGNSVNFGDKKIKKSNFYKNKKLFKIDDIDANKMLVSKKELYGTNKSIIYFIGYNDNDVIRPSCIMFSQIIGYVKCFDSNKAMSFKVIYKKLLKKYIKIWGKISSLVGKSFNSEPVYVESDKNIKTKIKSYGGNVNTNFQGKKISKENTSCECLSLIMLDSVIKINKKYYPQTLLEECEYEINKNKMKNWVNDGFDSSLSDESDSEPDSESDNESDNDGSNNEFEKPFKKSDNKSKNPCKKSDNESNNPFKESDNESESINDKSYN